MLGDYEAIDWGWQDTVVLSEVSRRLEGTYSSDAGKIQSLAFRSSKNTFEINID